MPKKTKPPVKKSQSKLMTKAAAEDRSLMQSDKKRSGTLKRPKEATVTLKKKTVSSVTPKKKVAKAKPAKSKKKKLSGTLRPSDYHNKPAHKVSYIDPDGSGGGPGKPAKKYKSYMEYKNGGTIQHD